MAKDADSRLPELSRLERKVLALVRETGVSGRVLELAPGKGALSAALAGLGLTVEALDIHPENFQGPKEVRLHRGDLDRPLPFADASYDTIICCEGIEHLERQYDFARELARVLRPGGLLLLTTPNILNWASRLRFLFTGFYALTVRPSSEFGRDRTIAHIYPLTFWQLRHILHTAGLAIERVETDHRRRSSLPGLLFRPLLRLLTARVLATEPEPRQRAANREIVAQLHGPALLLGRTQIVVARREASSYES